MPNNPRAVDNLIPAKKGEVRNPNGKPKGTKHLSTWIQDLLNDESFEAELLDNKLQYKGAPVKAIITVGIMKALEGDNRWAEWLAKHGYGEKLDITSKGERLEASPIIISNIKPRGETGDEQIQA